MIGHDRNTKPGFNDRLIEELSSGKVQITAPDLTRFPGIPSDVR
jgi:hypothetical protein